ncbi:MAG: zinc ribbon domain-containing protein [Treponema sp.]|nr:zinc ribbon domain-containing protein [Treponema sp.]
MSKRPRFFCDNCGAEVDRGEKACPRCGRFFASVRCPACGYTDDENAFKNGCPSCGYSAPPGASYTARPPEKKVPAGPLPLWVYLLSIAAFIVVAILLLRLAA